MLKKALKNNVTAREARIHHQGGAVLNGTSNLKQLIWPTSSGAISLQETRTSSVSSNCTNSILDTSSKSQVILVAYSPEEDHDSSITTSKSSSTGDESRSPDLHTSSPSNLSDLTNNDIKRTLLRTASEGGGQASTSRMPVARRAVSFDAAFSGSADARLTAPSKSKGRQLENNEINVILPKSSNFKGDKATDLTTQDQRECKSSDAHKLSRKASSIPSTIQLQKHKIPKEVHVPLSKTPTSGSIQVAPFKSDPNMRAFEKSNKACHNQRRKVNANIQSPKSPVRSAKKVAQQYCLMELSASMFIRASPVQNRLYALSKKLQEEGKERRKKAGKISQGGEDQARTASRIVKPSRAQIRLYNQSKHLQEVGKRRRKEAEESRISEDLRARNDAKKLSARAQFARSNAVHDRLYRQSQENLKSQKRIVAMEKISKETDEKKRNRIIHPSPAQLRLYNESSLRQELGKERRKQIEEHKSNQAQTARRDDWNTATIIKPNRTQIRLYNESSRLQVLGKERRKQVEDHVLESQGRKKRRDGLKASTIKPNHTQIRLYNKSKRLQELGRERRKEVEEHGGIQGNNILSARCIHAKPHAVHMRLYMHSQRLQVGGRHRRKQVKEKIHQNFPDKPFQIRSKSKLCMSERSKQDIRKKGKRSAQISDKYSSIAEYQKAVVTE